MFKTRGFLFHTKPVFFFVIAQETVNLDDERLPYLENPWKNVYENTLLLVCVLTRTIIILLLLVTI